jgi:hypothetical protein
LVVVIAFGVCMRSWRRMRQSCHTKVKYLLVSRQNNRQRCSKFPVNRRQPHLNRKASREEIWWFLNSVVVAEYSLAP